MWAEINMQKRRALCKDNDMLRQFWMYISYSRILLGLHAEGNSMKMRRWGGCEGAAKIRHVLWMLQRPQPSHRQFFPSQSRQDSALWMERVVMRAVINRGVKKKKLGQCYRLCAAAKTSSCESVISDQCDTMLLEQQNHSTNRYFNYFFKA